MPDWPTGSFPFIDDVNNYRETGPQDNVLRTPMDAGPDKTRRRFTAARSLLNGQTDVVTDAQVASFKTWFSNTIFDGAVSFTADHPRTGVSTDFRFAAPYEILYVGGDQNRIVMQLEVLP